jgi:hypothetical protein
VRRADSVEARGIAATSVDGSSRTKGLLSGDLSWASSDESCDLVRPDRDWAASAGTDSELE